MEKVYMGSVELIEDVKDWLGVGNFDDVMNYVETGKTRDSFATYERNTPILRKDNYYIDLREFFTSNEYGGDYEHLTVSELEEFLHEHGVHWNESEQYYTYNWNGNFQRDVNYRVYSNDEDETVLAFFSIHVGLDARAGFTESFAMKFDSEYDLNEFMLEDFTVANVEFVVNDIKMIASISVNGVSEYITIDCYDDDFELYDDSAFAIDLYDKEDLTASFIDYLTEQDIDFVKGTVKVLD